MIASLLATALICSAQEGAPGEEGAPKKVEAPKSVPALGLIPGGAKKDGKAAKPRVGEEVARIKLEMEPRALPREVHRKSFMMLYGNLGTLSREKPERIVKEPAYAGTPRYGTISVGNGPNPTFDVVFDDAEAGEAIYLDADQDGDLTDDPKVEWESVTKHEQGTSQTVDLAVRATFVDPDGKESRGDYGLTLIKQKGADRISLFRVGARAGTLQLGDKTYRVLLADNTADARYRNDDSPKPRKQPVWLLIDIDGDGTYKPNAKGREVLDTSGAFPIEGEWYVASFPVDGSELVLNKTDAPPPKPEVPRNPLLKVGQAVPDFEYVLADGGKARLSDSRGKVRVLDFWATWCGPCIAAMPKVEALHQKVKGQGVEVLGLAVMDEREAFDNWIDKSGGKYSYRFGFDASGARHEAGGVADKWGVYAIPTLFVIDKDDKIALVLTGLSAEGEEKLVETLKGLGVEFGD